MTTTLDEYKKELHRRFEVDQKEQKIEVYTENVEWLKEQIKIHGIPTHENTDEHATQAGWIIAQHADHDREFQKQYLELLHEQKDKVSPTWIAYLTDRVSIAETGKQVFGTQLTMVDGVRTLKPVDHDKTLDELRRAFGMPTVEWYLDFCNKNG